MPLFFSSGKIGPYAAYIPREVVILGHTDTKKCMRAL